MDKSASMHDKWIWRRKIRQCCRESQNLVRTLTQQHKKPCALSWHDKSARSYSWEPAVKCRVLDSIASASAWMEWVINGRKFCKIEAFSGCRDKTSLNHSTVERNTSEHCTLEHGPSKHNIAPCRYSQPEALPMCRTVISGVNKETRNCTSSQKIKIK